MSKEDADLFTRLCSIVWEGDDHVLHPLALDLRDIGIIPGVDLGFQEFTTLDTLGLIRFESIATHQRTYKFEDRDPNAEPPEHMETTWYYHGRPYQFLTPVARIIMAKRKNPAAAQATVNLETGHVSLTEMGQELYPIAGGKPNEAYLRCLFDALAKRNWIVRKKDGA
jgi:hypothetical protein